MKKKGIFIKIYLSFWLFTVLIVLSQMVLDRLTQTGPFGGGHFRNFHESILAAYASNMIKLHFENVAQKGTPASTSYEFEDIELFIVDESLNDISGKKLDEEAKRASTEAFNNTEGGPPTPPGPFGRAGQRFFSRRIKGPDGRNYAVTHRYKIDEIPPGMQPERMVLRGLVILLVSAGFCYLLAKYISTPILALREAAQRFSEGELNYRIGGRFAGRKDEFSELAATFDKMTEKIELLMKLQRQLLGDVSHELRSPLARLGVALELARKQSGEAAQKSLERIGREAEALNSLIGEVLTLTKIESGIETAQTAPLDLCRMIQKIVSDADFEARGSGKSVSLKECESMTIEGSEDLLKHAVENVVRNAIKYGPQNSAIEVALRKAGSDAGNALEITVADSGSGVPEKELSNIFDPFYRVSNARERSSGGSGLGLAITRRSVLLHGGSVYASNRETGGLIVTINLPLRPDARP